MTEMKYLPVLPALLLCASAALAHDDPADPAHEHPASIQDVFKTSEPVVIDGRLDESSWKTATPISADYLGSKTGVKSEAPRMIAKYAWDEQYLYIAYETFDANLVALGLDEWQGPP